MNNTFIYDKVNETLFEELEKGNIPWKKPWKTGLPINFVSKREYGGWNWWMLLIIQESKGYQSNMWGSFKQIKDNGGTVKKGEKSTMVYFWKIYEVHNPLKSAEKGKMVFDKIPLLRYYNVFNLDQTEGIKLKDNERVQVDIPEADTLIETYSKKEARIQYGRPQAFYSPKEDYINLPHRETFTDDNEFYCTAFHEITHSTGHEKRLNRIGERDEYNHTFGSEDYSKEELIAELGASYLCAKTGILPNVVKNNAAYIRGWLKALKNDRTLLLSAAGKAQRATEFILKV